MFYFRLNRISIFDAREGRKFLLFGKSRKAEVKIMSFVTTDQTSLPDMDDLAKEIDPDKQKELIEKAVSSVVSSRILTTIQNVRDDHKFTFGDAGYVLYKSEKAPKNLDWLLLVIESDQESRDNAALVQQVVNHDKFGELSKNILMSVVKKANPAAGIAVEIVKFVGDVLLEKGKKNKDDQIGLVYMSLNRHEHYPHLERKKDSVPDLTNNMTVDYSIFGVEED